MVKVLLKTVKVETVSDKILVHFTKELVTVNVYEPLNPAFLFVRIVTHLINYYKVLYKFEIYVIASQLL